MITVDVFAACLDRLGDVGAEDLRWSEAVGPPASAEAFATEAIYVICNSGMRYTVAARIFGKVTAALRDGRSARSVFNHPGKAAAIDRIWRDRKGLFKAWQAVPARDAVEWLGGLPWIGPITKYHLAKNFGVDCVKPDVHLARLAAACGESPDVLCARLATATGLRKATVDVVLWRAAATGVLNSSTARLTGARWQEPEPDLFDCGS